MRRLVSKIKTLVYDFSQLYTPSIKPKQSQFVFVFRRTLLKMAQHISILLATLFVVSVGFLASNAANLDLSPPSNPITTDDAQFPPTADLHVGAETDDFVKCIKLAECLIKNHIFQAKNIAATIKIVLKCLEA